MDYFFGLLAFVMFCYMLDGRGCGRLIVKLVAQFVEQAIIDTMGIVYPQY
jgi:hypothetical protein